MTIFKQDWTVSDGDRKKGRGDGLKAFFGGIVLLGHGLTMTGLLSILVFREYLVRDEGLAFRLRRFCFQ